MDNPHLMTRPWYSEGMVWLVILIPLSALVAGAWTVWAANQNADAPIERVEPVGRTT
ncbi:MAG: hypothetical protein ACKO0U_08465 [Gammaproteobacteria bacterium]